MKDESWEKFKNNNVVTNYKEVWDTAWGEAVLLSASETPIVDARVKQVIADLTLENQRLRDDNARLRRVLSEARDAQLNANKILSAPCFLY